MNYITHTCTHMGTHTLSQVVKVWMDMDMLQCPCNAAAFMDLQLCTL